MPDATSVAFLTLLWIAVAWRAFSVPRGTLNRSLWLTLACLAAAVTADGPTTAAAINRLSGITELATLLTQLAGLGAAAALFHYLHHVLNPDAGRTPPGWLRWLATTSAATVSLLLAVQPRNDDHLGHSLAPPSPPGLAGYWIVFALYLATPVALIGRLSWRHSRRAPTPRARAALRLLAVGAILGVAYALMCIAALIAHATGSQLPDAWLIVTKTDEYTAVLGILAGSTMPAADLLARAVHACSDLRRLYPLWHALRQAAPDIELATPTGLFPCRIILYRRYRRLIEIRDGILTLHPYLPADAPHFARDLALSHGIPHDYLDVVTEAVEIEVARRRKLAGHPQTTGTAPVLATSYSRLHQERVRLLAVAGAFTSPTVATLATAVENALAP